jgi:hypothetical protein
MMPEPFGLAGGIKLAAMLADPRRAVSEDAIICLLCGGLFRQLTNTHLRGHGMTAHDYKRRFGYNRRRALMCGSLRRLYAERALRTELASRIGWRPIVQEPELRRLGGMRPTTLEERLTRADRRSAVRRPGMVLLALLFLALGGVAEAAGAWLPRSGVVLSVNPDERTVLLEDDEDFSLIVVDAGAPIVDGLGAPRTLSDVTAGDVVEYRDEPFAAMRIAMELRVVSDTALAPTLTLSSGRAPRGARAGTTRPARR